MKYVLFNIADIVCRWGWIVFIFSLAAKHLNFHNEVVSYSNEAVLPFYILHQTVILCIGWFVLPLDLGILLKFLIVTIGSFILIIALYEGLVRHFNLVRFLFDMRPKKRQVKAQPNKN